MSLFFMALLYHPSPANRSPEAFNLQSAGLKKGAKKLPKNVLDTSYSSLALLFILILSVSPQHPFQLLPEYRKQETQNTEKQNSIL